MRNRNSAIGSWNVSELSPQFFVRYMNYKKYSPNLIFLPENPKTYITTFLIHVQVSQDGVCSTRYRSVRLLLLVVVVSMAPKKIPPPNSSATTNVREHMSGTRFWVNFDAHKIFRVNGFCTHKVANSSMSQIVACLDQQHILASSTTKMVKNLIVAWSTFYDYTVKS